VDHSPKKTKARPGRPRGENGTEATKTLDRGLSLLEQVGFESLTLSEIARRADLHPSTAYRLVRTLTSRGFLVYDEQEGLYRLGSRILSLAGSAPAQQQLVEATKPLLAQLKEQFNETVNLSIREGVFILYLNSIESTQALRVFSDTGSRVPLHATACGKALLVDMEEALIRQVFGKGALESFTEKTITSLDTLIAEVKETEKRGYALDIEERQEGVVCVAVPLRIPNMPEAALSITGPINRVTATQIPKMAEALMKVAEAASK